MAANGEFAGDLAQQSATLGSVLFPETANIRGTLEFDAPSGAQIGVIGIRTPPTTTYTKFPALVKEGLGSFAKWTSDYVITCASHHEVGDFEYRICE